MFGLDLWMIWLGIFLIALIVEIISLGLTSIWFAGGALVAAIAAGLHAPVIVQIILFIAVSVLLIVFTRPVAVRYFNKNRKKTNVESMIGRQAIVISEIDNLQGIGQATVGGQEWSARSEDDNIKIPVGAVGTVVAVKGVKLILKV